MFQALLLAGLEEVAKMSAGAAMGWPWRHLGEAQRRVAKAVVLGAAQHVQEDPQWSPVPLPPGAEHQRLASWTAPVFPPAGAAGPSAAAVPSSPAEGARLPPKD